MTRRSWFGALAGFCLGLLCPFTKEAKPRCSRNPRWRNYTFEYDRKEFEHRVARIFDKAIFNPPIQKKG